MGELKPGWRRVQFRELAECMNDRVDDPVQAGVDRYVGLEHLDPESLMIRRWGSPDQVESTKLRFRPGDIIFGKRRAYQRKLAVADFDGICSAHAMVLRAQPGKILPEFLPFFMQGDTFMERAQAISVGSLSPTISWKTLAAEEFALPSLEEQRHLVGFFQAVWNVVDRSVDMAKALEGVEAALLAEQFPSEKVSPMQQTVPLSELADVSLGYKVSPVHKGERTTLAIVTVAQLQDDWFDLSNVRDTTIPQQMVSSFRPQEGALLVTEGGNLDQLGRGAVWRGQLKNCVFQNHVFSIKPKTQHTLVEFLEGLMRSPRGREFFLRNAKRTSNLATIDKRKVMTMPVPVVAPAIQRIWVERYLSIRRALSEATRRVTEARQLLRVTSGRLQGG